MIILQRYEQRPGQTDEILKYLRCAPRLLSISGALHTDHSQTVAAATLPAAAVASALPPPRISAKADDANAREKKVEVQLPRV